ncbi:MAG: endonuclease/exonuclease/phosphatase family protein [Rhodobacteraceae bacterium]|jgi:endonuclease/exonuclease/phosphatase family metal-dependent hydrolase|uniref:endonuclease/exonuclease/phosphatase family protein n=1 Tax=Albidovulum sp. TaxID=1872424 RepID=UPI00265ACE97|nr:endonuclease/exonuclease/phosphatase family protein [uncultured Defluviimonas sp.]MCC0068621.1 endonuclease/exonuclease/phosphatase family protein [Paracoccaceae bacterium]
MQLRLASYNVHKCLGMDRRRSPERIVSVLNALDADIVALQEVDHRLPPRPAALPRALIERETDFGVLPFAPEGPSLGWHGQTMLVRRGIAVEKVRRLLLPGLEPRGAILAELGPEYGGLRVVGAHLGLIRRYRRMQFAAIRAAIGRRGDRPTAIIGDFNDWSAHGGAEALGPAFRLHAPGPSFPAARPIGALDRVAISSGIHLVTAGVHRLAPAALASDHLPVWVDLRVEPPEALA